MLLIEYFGGISVGSLRLARLSFLSAMTKFVDRNGSPELFGERVRVGLERPWMGASAFVNMPQDKALVETGYLRQFILAPPTL